MQINMHEAKSQLSRLGERVIRGERVIIARAGKPWLELVPYRAERRERRPGRLRDEIRVAPDFQETPETIVDDFTRG